MQNALTVSQIFTSVEEIIPITWILHGWAPLDHMYMNVTLEILEIDKTAQANLISIQNIHDTFDYSAAPFSRVHSWLVIWAAVFFKDLLNNVPDFLTNTFGDKNE